MESISRKTRCQSWTSLSDTSLWHWAGLTVITREKYVISWLHLTRFYWNFVYMFILCLFTSYKGNMNFQCILKQWQHFSMYKLNTPRIKREHLYQKKKEFRFSDFSLLKSDLQQGKSSTENCESCRQEFTISLYQTTTFWICSNWKCLQTTNPEELKIMKLDSEKVKSLLGKGEIVGYQHFSLKLFPNAFFHSTVEIRDYVPKGWQTISVLTTLKKIAFKIWKPIFFF